MAWGLTVTGATVLHDLSSVVVHLASASVVARVPVVVPYHSGPDSRMCRMWAELDVTQWLADRGYR